MISTDCFEDNKPNHRGEINTEYISPEKIIESIEKAGFFLINDPFFLSSYDINLSGLDGISVDTKGLVLITDTEIFMTGYFLFLKSQNENSYLFFRST